MTLKEVLADKTAFPDNIVWNMGTGTAVTLGELRGLSATQQTELSKRENDIASAQAALGNSKTELEKAQLNTANLYTNLQTAQRAIQEGKFDTLPKEIKDLFGPMSSSNNGNNRPNDPFADISRLENDTLMGPVVQVIKATREEARKAQAAVEATTKVQQQMATNYINGVLEDRYDRLVPLEKQEKLPLATLIQTAVRANQFSADSTPNIKWALKELTAGDTAAEREAAIRADERKKAKEEMAANGGGNGINIPPPTSFGLDVHNRSGAAPKAFANLDEAFAAAAKDKDIWSQVDAN